jgi:hypothetical protein
MRGVWILVVCGLVVGAFAIQRAAVANDAQSKMIGLSKEQVLACMGVPATKATEGITEVWSYASGNKNNKTAGSTFGNVGRGGGLSAVGVFENGFCTFNVTMVGGSVSRTNYVGPTSDLLAPNEQCAFAVQNCIH